MARDDVGLLLRDKERILRAVGLTLTGACRNIVSAFNTADLDHQGGGAVVVPASQC